MLRPLLLVLCLLCSLASHAKGVLGELALSNNDAVLVVDHQGNTVYDWQAEVPLIPASLTKLATSYLAIKKWGVDHHFVTDFYLEGNVLWVKGYGDPFLISEELDLIAERLVETLPGTVAEIRIDNSYFENTKVPGNTQVNDPYNAPLSAVSANFNTVMLQRVDGQIISAEPQTPLTETALRVAQDIGRKVERVNLIDANNAQRNFAEILRSKAGWPTAKIAINQSLPASAKLIYQHKNTRPLSDVLRGTLEYSNNFIANHVFTKLADQTESHQVLLAEAVAYATQTLTHELGWHGFTLVEGAGLSRKNRLSARQLDDLLRELWSYRTLFKEYEADDAATTVYAKTGTLSNVHSFAGYIEMPEHHYRFVFNFSRSVPYRYREQLLAKLINDLQNRRDTQ